MVTLSAVTGSSWLAQVSSAVEGTLLGPVNGVWVLDETGLLDDARVLDEAVPLLVAPPSVRIPQPEILRIAPIIIRYRYIMRGDVYIPASPYDWTTVAQPSPPFEYARGDASIGYLVPSISPRSLHHSAIFQICACAVPDSTPISVCMATALEAAEIQLQYSLMCVRPGVWRPAARCDAFVRV
jgi:hypothetical protein